MSQIKFPKQHKAVVVIVFFFAAFVFSQDTAKIRNFSGAITATNNGISLLPTFSLGKPAAIFDFSLKSKRWSFDPQLRFSLEGKPWSFIFWGRYNVINNAKFRLSFGAHPAIAFKEEKIFSLNGETKMILNAYRYTASEIAPNIILSKNITVGMYYLYSHGWDEGTTNNTHFVTVNSTISNIPLFSEIFLKLKPHLYYLKMDNKDGFYFTSTISLANKKSPFELSSIINKSIKTAIPGKDMVWNLSLTYNY